MKNKPPFDLMDGHYRIFGTMDGFSLIEWAVKIENDADYDVYCWLSIDLLDNHGNAIETPEGWRWYQGPYAKKSYAPMDRLCRHLIKRNATKTISGIIKTTSQEADIIAGIDFRADRVVRCDPT